MGYIFAVDILQRRAHNTCEATLNNRSTAVGLGSVALLFPQNFCNG